MGNEPDPLDIPPSLKRDVNNKAEFMKMAVDVDVESRPAKAPKKANGAAADKAATVKAAKPQAKAKTAPKATAAPAKAPKKVASGRPKAEPAEKDQYGFRKGSAKSKAAAMYGRKNGATLAEVKEAVGSVQLNVLNGLEEDGYPVERLKVEREGQRPVTRYVLKPKK